MATGSTGIKMTTMFGSKSSTNNHLLSDTRFLVTLSDELSSRELTHLVFLCRDVVLPHSVTDKIRSFPDLVRELENKDGPTRKWKITKDMKDYLVLFDILELIRRKNLIKKIKEYGKKCSELDKKKNPDASTGITPMKLFPVFECNGQNELDITEEKLVLTEVLKKGEYSDFWKGQMDSEHRFLVEVYKVQRSSDIQQSFAAQGDIQCRLKHPSIVDVLRVFRNREFPWIVMEWMENGDLSTFLRSSNSQRLSNDHLIAFSAQIVDAMCYMEKSHYAHCNLRADSLFLTSDCRVKVGGFCLARKLLRPENVCELEEDVRLSLRWSSLDVIRYRQVTDKSDVWSFGVVLLELFTKGETPYQDMETKEVLTKLRKGYRHPQPENCPKGIYHLMRCCWNMPEDLRPSFSDLRPCLENYEDERDYGSNPRLTVAAVPTDASVSGYRRSTKRGERQRPEPSTSKSDKRDSYVRYIGQSCLVSDDPNEVVGKRRSLFATQSTSDIELDRNEFVLLEQIGAGEFGEVWKAKWCGERDVAIKMFIPTRTEPQDFLDEAKMMKKFNHPHIVSLLGVCSTGLPIFIITELMPLGNLLDYLRNDGGVTLHTEHLLKYAAQVADAMVNVEALNCIHRDLAARNVLVADVNTVKLADFGLSRSLISTYYQVKHDLRLPARWTAPEIKRSSKFSIKSDVWAFGVFLVELMTYGEIPYSDMNHHEVLEQVSKGYKHPQPVDTCPDDIYEVMITCWRIKPDRRPSFLELLQVIRSLIKVYDRNPEKTRKDLHPSSAH